MNHTEEKVTEQGGTRKRARTDVADDENGDAAADVAFDLYRTFLDALDDEDDSTAQDDVFQQLVQVIETSSILPFQDSSLSSIQTPTRDMIGILASIVYFQMASTAIEKYLHGDMTQQPHVFIAKSLEYYPMNAACRSLAANFFRITNDERPKETVTSWYQQAARDAQQVRHTTLELLESKHVHDSVKEWMELLLLQQVVDVEYNDDDGSFSASTVEGTARFMAAILLSRDDHHDEALQELQSFPLTHRLHPNVWSGQNDSNVLARRSITTTTTPPVSFRGVLPPKLYEKMCNTFAPDALFWKESDYDNMGYYSFLADIDGRVKNLIDDVVIHHLLPLAHEVLGNKAHAICAYEWWAHSRQASLGHALHFDTDKATIDTGEHVHHPILSSVLHLTGDAATSGATIVLDQTLHSKSCAQVCWRSVPQPNTFMVFPGDLLHGVLPCPGSDSKDKSTSSNRRRLTFMVGFKTRSVPDQRRGKALYGPCAPLPPDTEAWVQEIQSGYDQPKETEARVAGMEMEPLPCVTPAWEEIATSAKHDGSNNDPPLELPQSIDQRFFINGEPAEYFRQSLFEHDDVP